MVAPTPSRLDDRQILQGAYDEATGTLRTSAQATIVNADISVAIDAVSDSISIKSSDGLREIGINDDGSIDVTDGLKSGGVYGAVTMTLANTAYEAKFGGTRLAGRKAIHVAIMTNGVYWGLDSSVTVANGTPTAMGQALVFTADPSSSFTIFLVCATPAATFRIVEIP